MKESFSSVREFLDYWEFCPLCGKRNEMELGCRSARIPYLTSLDNEYLTARKSSNDNKVCAIELCNNKLHNYSNRTLDVFLDARCKNFHFLASYDLKEAESPKPQINKISCLVKKKKESYHLLSNYNKPETIINMSNHNSGKDIKIIDVIRFNLFDKNNLIKQFKALALLY